MKKILCIFVLIVSILCVLASCNSSDLPKETNTSTSEEVIITTPEETNVTTPVETTPEVTTPEVTTPEATTPKEPILTTPGLAYEVNDDGKTCIITYFGTCTESDISIGNHIDGYEITAIGDGAFYGTNLTSVTIGDSVTTIGEWAFGRCESLTSVTIGDSVTTIDGYAFAYCSTLTSITVSENNTAYQSINGNLYSKDGTVLVTYAGGKTDTFFVVPNIVTTIGDLAFALCSSLTSVTIPDSVTTIGDGAFYNCINLASFVVDENNTAYQSINGNLYSKDGTVLFAYACGKLDEIFVIPDSVTTIGLGTFAGCTNLASVTIGDSVTTIGYSAFYSCTSLTSVAIGNSVTTIGINAFGECESLMSITIPNSVTTIGENAFYGCSNLTTVTIPDSVITIGIQAFCLCDSLTSVIIGDSVISIDRYAFYKCFDLANVIIGNSVVTIGYGAFSDCNLTSVTIPNSVTTIGDRAFSASYYLTSITFEGTVEQWNAISKGNRWDSSTGEYTIYCTDGTIAKDGTVTLN